MVSSNNRTFLIFSAVLALLLIVASVCIVAGYVLISPIIEEQLSGESPSGGPLAYITSPADSSVYVVDTSTKRTIASVRFDEPPSLAIPGPGDGLFVAAGKSVYIVDAKELKTVRNITYPGLVQHIAFSPDGGQAYVEYDGDGASISELDTKYYRSIGNVANMPDSPDRRTAMSPDGRYRYVTDYDMNTNTYYLNVIDAGSGVKLKDTPIAPGPKYMRITPDGRYLFICFENAPVEVVNTKTLWVEGNLGFIGNSVEFSRAH